MRARSATLVDVVNQAIRVDGACHDDLDILQHEQHVISVGKRTVLFVLELADVSWPWI
jgi:hypothetical protein